MERTKRQQPPTFSQNISSYFSQYCGATSIHGVQYLGERGRFVIEKLTWVILITIVCYVCIFLIMKSYYKWVTSPVVVSFGTEEIPIHKIPFPAVTICPQVKTNPEIFNYTDVAIRLRTANVEEVTEAEKLFFNDLALVCQPLDEIKPEDKYNDIFAKFRLLQIFPDHRSDNMTTATWLGNNISTDSLSLISTEYGLCYNFNMLNVEDTLTFYENVLEKLPQKSPHVKEWTSDGGYSSPFSPKEYPKRTYLSGPKGGFAMELFTDNKYIDYLCGENPEGFKVTLHFPSDWPSMDRHVHVPLDYLVLISIQPKLITISDQLKSYSIKDRKCYLATERKLNYFKMYSQENCLIECLTNYTARTCGCIPFYAPTTPGYQICGYGSFECVQNSKVKFQSDEENLDNTKQKQSKCNCLPSCVSLQYDIEVTQSPWNWQKSVEAMSIVNPSTNIFDYERPHLSKINIYYKDMQFINTKRNELYGYVDFFSSTGGLMGLFIGISVTSGLEILYFLTLRLICNIKMYGKLYWSGDESLMNTNSDRIDKDN